MLLVLYMAISFRLSLRGFPKGSRGNLFEIASLLRFSQ